MNDLNQSLTLDVDDRLEYLVGARGFPHYVVKVSVNHHGVITRRIMAQCEHRDDAEGLIFWANEGLELNRIHREQEQTETP